MSDPITTASPPPPPQPSNAPDPVRAVAPRARPFPLVPYLLATLLALSVLLAGLAMLFWMPDQTDAGTVNEVRVSAKPGIDFSKLHDVLDTPDYFLEVMTDLGSIRTAKHEDTPLGNGLTFKLPVPLRLDDVREIKVWDENSLRKDALVDRVDRPTRSVAGERFRFELSGATPSPPKERRVGWALAGCGGAALLLTVLHFIRAQAL